jgi:hypothetical protein
MGDSATRRTHMAKKALKKGKKLAGTKTLTVGSATGGAGAGRASF